MAPDRLDILALKQFAPTPSQTVGPFFHYSLPWKGGADLVGNSGLGARPELFPAEHDILNETPAHGSPSGEVIDIYGRVLDGGDAPLPDAMIEIWQANALGRYDSAADPREELPLDENFRGFGRSSTNEQGEFRFRTIRPGPAPGPGDILQAPHIAVAVFGRGLLKRLVTRLYFADEAANKSDPILAIVPKDRRDTLIAFHHTASQWRFDIVLQGPRETVFFDF